MTDVGAAPKPPLGPRQPPSPVALGRADIHPVTLDQAAALVLDWAPRRDAALVVTPNVDHLVRLEQDADFRAAYTAARLRVADGVPLLWLSAACGRPLPGRVNGTDLFERTCAGAARAGLSVFIAGGMPDVLRSAVAALRQQFPGLRVDGWSPPVGFEGTAADLDLQERLAAADPDVVMICVGAPRSEKWGALQVRRRPGVYLCVGSAVDFAAGARRRAPRFMQEHGLEWLHRMVQEPRRLARRYLVEDRAFARIAVRELRASRRRAR